MSDKKISQLTNYTPILDADVFPVVDNANNTTKKITWANIKATLKTYFDTLYTTTAAVASTLASYATLASPALTGTPTTPTAAALTSTTQIASTAFVMGEKRGYTLQTGATSFSPADATTYYFGQYQGSVVGDTSEVHSRLYFPKAGIIKAIFIYIENSGTAGSAETSTMSFRLNATTDTTISAAVTTNAASNAFNNQALNIAVAAGDFGIIKWVTPTWVTNPTTLRVMTVIYVE